MYNVKKKYTTMMTGSIFRDTFLTSKRFKIIFKSVREALELTEDQELKPDYVASTFHSYDQTFFFEINQRLVVGLHKRLNGDAHVFLIQKSLEAIKNDYEKKSILPDAVFSIRRNENGTMVMHLRSESGSGVNITAMKPNSEAIAIKLLQRLYVNTFEFNIKTQKKNKKARAEAIKK